MIAEARRKKWRPRSWASRDSYSKEDMLVTAPKCRRGMCSWCMVCLPAKSEGSLDRVVLSNVESDARLKLDEPRR